MRTMVSEEKSMNIDDTVLVADGAKIVGEDLTIGVHSSVWYNAVIRQLTKEEISSNRTTADFYVNEAEKHWKA